MLVQSRIPYVCHVGRGTGAERLRIDCTRHSNVHSDGATMIPRPCTCDRCAIGKPWEPSQCSLCWLYHNRKSYRVLWGGPQEGADSTIGTQTQLGLFKLASNLLLAAGKLALDNFRTASKEQEQGRRRICESCVEYYDTEQQRCKHNSCGCSLQGQWLNKLKWASQECPIGKWKAV